MFKIVKKCFVSVVAVVMMATTSALSSNAATDHVTKTTPYGTMNGYLDVWTSGNYKYVQGTTTCSSNVSKITVAIAIVSYPNGNPIYDYNNTTISRNNAKSVSTAAYSLSKQPISAFGAHQVFGSNSYGDYTSLTNV